MDAILSFLVPAGIALIWLFCSFLGYVIYRHTWRVDDVYTLGHRCLNIAMSLMCGPWWLLIVSCLWIVVVLPMIYTDYIPIDFDDEAKW